MFQLGTKNFPQSASDFERALDESLRQYARRDGPIVSASSRVFPYFDQIAINLDGGRFDSGLPEPVRPTGETKEACEAAFVSVSARDIRIQEVPANVQLEARDVVFHKGEDENGDVLLIVRRAREGHVVISAAQLDLENAIGRMATEQARRKGISVENVRMALRARGARSLAADIQFQARKFLLRAKIDIYGQLDITDDFVAKISHLKCKADGALGSIACGALEPHLQRLNGSTFPLMSLPLGEIRLRDVRIAVADTVDITADFGSSDG